MTVSSLFKKLGNKHFLSLAGNGSMAVLGVVTYGILYRLLPENDMGNWIFFQTIFAVLDAIRTGFLQTALIKFYAGAGIERKANVAGSTWYIALVLSGALAILNIPAYMLFNHTGDQGILFFLQWYGVAMLLTCPFNVSFWILQAEERFDHILILRIINQGSFIVCLIGMHLLGPITLQRIAIFFLGCSLFTSLIPLFMGWARVSTIRHRSAAAVREIILFGRYSMGTYLCSTVFKHSDSIIIKFMIGPAALAIYNLAQRLLEVIEIPIRSLLGTAMPAMSVAYNNNENAKVSHIMKKYTGALTIILVPIIIAAFVMADVIVEIIGGQKYVDTEAANVFRLLICSAILYPIDRFSGITLDIIHKPHLNFVKIVLSLVVNVVVDIIAIKILGNVYGVAAASIVTILFGVGFGYITLNRYLPFNLHGILKLGYIESRTMVNGFLRKKPVL